MPSTLAEALPTTSKNGEATAGFRDPSFGHNRQFPLHRWVPWVAGFSAEFVNDCLRNYIAKNRNETAWVLDPFAGVGTTLVEAFLHGYNVLGFEVNPYAVLAVTAKGEAVKVNTALLADYISQFEAFMGRYCSPEAELTQPVTGPPVGFSGRTQLFSPRVQRQVLFALDFINAIRAGAIRDLFRVAFGSVMVSFSNYTYEPSLTRRATVGKSEIDDANVARALASKLYLMLDDTVWLQDHMASLRRKPQFKVVPRSIFGAQEELRRESFVDLVVTSPPYLNNYHYPRNTRPQIHWLGFSSKRGYEGANESQSFGKFWQTVRDLPPVKLDFELRQLKKTLGRVRLLNAEKGPYGGPGWANYIATYFNDTFRFWKQLRPLLRKNGAVVVVLGNSIIQGVEVATDRFFGEIAELCGLCFEETVLLRQKRTGSSIIQSSVRADRPEQKTVLYESAIVVRNA